MIRQDRLYECVNCGGLVATKHGVCPYCDASDGGTKTVQSLKAGETVERPKSLYRTVKLEEYDP